MHFLQEKTPKCSVRHFWNSVTRLRKSEYYKTAFLRKEIYFLPEETLWRSNVVCKMRNHLSVGFGGGSCAVGPKVEYVFLKCWCRMISKSQGLLTGIKPPLLKLSVLIHLCLGEIIGVIHDSSCTASFLMQTWINWDMGKTDMRLSALYSEHKSLSIADIEESQRRYTNKDKQISVARCQLCIIKKISSRTVWQEWPVTNSIKNWKKIMPVSYCALFKLK